jgi:PTH1 family peptidyl-tRNA hydrolase
MCVSHLARMQGIHFDRKQGHARTGIGNIAGSRVVLARPQTYMNASGESVSALLRKLNIPPSDLIVIHDDLDLPTGKVRLRLSGSSGGHKGIDSIIARIGTRDFYRVRVGIGRPDIDEGTAADKEEAIVAYVLTDFSSEEKKIIDEAIPGVSVAIVCLLAEGLSWVATHVDDRHRRRRRR